MVKTLINGNETISNNYYDSESKPTASKITKGTQIDTGESMEKIISWIYYLFLPWEKVNAHESIMLVTGTLYILVLLIFIYLSIRKKANSISLLLLVFAPSFAAFFCTFFYWYELLLILLYTYSISYKEIKDNMDYRERWHKDIKLSVALTVVLPVITIIVCDFLGFGYKLFP